MNVHWPLRTCYIMLAGMWTGYLGIVSESLSVWLWRSMRTHGRIRRWILYAVWEYCPAAMRKFNNPNIKCISNLVLFFSSRLACFQPPAWLFSCSVGLSTVGIFGGCASVRNALTSPLFCSIHYISRLPCCTPIRLPLELTETIYKRYGLLIWF